MKLTDKLRVLIPYWIEHNQEPAGEFRDWANLAGEATQDILAAADLIAQVNQSLEAAQEKLGGALEYHHTP